MAHIGKQYRLHLRRDVALNISNNRNAIPAEVFASFSAVQVDDFFHPYNTGPKLATLQTPETDFPIIWETANMTQHGHTFKMRFTLDDVDVTNGCTRGLFNIYSGGLIRLSQRISPFPAVGGNRAYASWQSGAPPSGVITYDKPYWGTDLNTIGLTIAARLWGQ